MAFGELRSAIEQLDVPTDGHAISELIALSDQLHARIAEAVGQFDAAASWDLDGEGSLKSWLKAHAKMTNGQANRLAADSKRLRRTPVTLAAWRDGGLSSGQVEVIVRWVKPYAVDLFAAHEPAVIPDLIGLSVIETIIAMDAWAEMADAVLDPPEPPERDRTVQVSRLPGGDGLLKGHLDEQCRALVDKAIRVAMTDDREGDTPRSWGRRRHDALADVAKFFLDNQAERVGGSHRPHLNVIVHHDDPEVGRYSDGVPVDKVSMSTLWCDCNIHRVLVDAKSATIDYGRATKTISADLRTALIVRDRGCRFPGCDRSALFSDGHHVKRWIDGGPTNPANVALLCRSHHRTLHKRGWYAELDPDGTLTITSPDGRVRTTRPPGLDRPLAA